MSHSLYRTLKVQYPDASIDVMAPHSCCSLLKRMPEINQVITMPLGHGVLNISQRYRLGKMLRNNYYDHAYVLPNSFKSALIPFFASIPCRIGWKGEMRYGLLTNVYTKINKNILPLMVERYVALAYPLQEIKTTKKLSQPLLWPILSVSNKEITETITKFNLTYNRYCIGLCPGAEFGPAKRWPHYHYATLAQKLIEEGYHIFFFGSDKDKTIANNIYYLLKKNRNNCSNLIGKTTLDQVTILIAACRAIVTNDSGLMHIAAALNKPLVALYGPSSPNFTPPLSNTAKIIRLSTGYLKIRKGNAEYNYDYSLTNIKPDVVLQELKLLLKREI
ncbi:ADP-heptose--LPS heptosyltransferase 2 [Candidatus Profftia lariciata]|nr:ADP-heptose--LPS heptosyltransferase 2 [Candidatus Profftia lariciata]